MTFSPSVSPEIFALRPDYRALSIVVTNAKCGPSDDESQASLLSACAQLDAAPWADAHLESWREAYRAFGAKPQRTPCSAEALRKRAQRDGSLPLLNAAVDLYNAISLRFALPIGGEDIAGYQGSPILVRARGDEVFETVQDGAPREEHPEPGEVIWRDERGVTCRRWNWRQGVRTRIEDSSIAMWFVLERLDPMPIEALYEAGDQLIQSLTIKSPRLTSQVTLLTP